MLIMANNKFIEKFLMNLSLANPRLRCPLTRLHIQIEMQSPSVQSLIQYFLMLQPEYQYNLRNLGSLKTSSVLNMSVLDNTLLTNTSVLDNTLLTNIAEFVQLKDYLTGQKLLYFDEADWLEDAIHETLLDED